MNKEHTTYRILDRKTGAAQSAYSRALFDFFEAPEDYLL